MVWAVTRSRRTDDDLRALLSTLDPSARNDLRRVLIRDQADRDAISSRLMRYRDLNGLGWADIIDFLTMYPEARRRVVRLLGEITASSALSARRPKMISSPFEGLAGSLFGH
jgi:hypothetical protein